MKERDSFVDIAKGICILLVVCIHTEVFEIIGMPITFIAVPMFFFMSGFYDRSEKPLAQWIVKALRTLVLPAIIWVALGFCYLEFLSFLKDKSFRGLEFDLYNPCIGNGPAWFLFALFYLKLIVWVLSKIRVSKYLLLPFTYVLGYIGSTYQMPLLIDEGLAALPLFFTGKVFYPYIKTIVVKWGAVCLGIIGLLLVLFHYVYYTIVPIENGCYKPYYLVGIFAVEIVIGLVLFLTIKMQSCVWLEKMGKRTLGVMLLHAPMCHTVAVILNRIFTKGSMIWIICFLCAYVLIVGLAFYLTSVIENYCPLLLGKTNEKS